MASFEWQWNEISIGFGFSEMISWLVILTLNIRIASNNECLYFHGDDVNGAVTAGLLKTFYIYVLWRQFIDTNNWKFVWSCQPNIIMILWYLDILVFYIEIQYIYMFPIYISLFL